MTPDTTIVFVHVPKAAGSSLSQLLRNHFGKNFLECNHVDLVGGLDPIRDFDKGCTGPRAITGHLGIGIEEALAHDPTYVTILRDPVDRLVSYYYYALETSAQYLHQFLRNGEVTLREFVESVATIEIDNMQVRQLSGNNGLVNEKPYGKLSREDLKRAKDCLSNRFSLVGISEDFDGTMVCFQRLIGLRHVYYRRMNVTRRRSPLDQIPEEIMRVIRRSQAFDLELYEHGRRLYHEKVEEFGKDFPEHLAKFRVWNARYNWLYDQMVASFPYRAFWAVKNRVDRYLSKQKR